jgi:hypothetical protein
VIALLHQCISTGQARNACADNADAQWRVSND